MRPHRRSLVPVLLGALALAGCATISTPSSPLMKRVGKSQMKPEELRIRVRALAPRFSGQLEELADAVAQKAADAPTRLAMARFKTNTIPAMQSALFQPDPAAALIDAWALVAQLQDVLGKVQPASAERTQLAAARFQAMEQELSALWGELTGSADTSKARDTVHAWAVKNPIEGSVASRPTTTELLASLTAQAGTGPLGTAGRLVETTQDLSARLDLETTFLPKQARWQAETFMLDALQSPAYRDALPELPALLAALQAVTQQLRGLPWLVARERTALLAAVRDERLGAQGYVTGEREALVGELKGERAAVLAEVDRTVQRGVDHAFDRAQHLVDRMFFWFAGLLVLGVVGGALVALLVVRAWRSRGHPGELRPRREAHA